MAFAGMNHLAVLLAAIAAFIFGGAWYGVLGRAWLAALGKPEAAIRSGPPMALRMAVAVAALVFMGLMLAGGLGPFRPGQGAPRHGLVPGFFLRSRFCL